MKCDKVKLEIANAERQLKYDEDSYKKQIVEINSMLVNRDAQSQVVENKKVAQITIKTDTTDTFNQKLSNQQQSYTNKNNTKTNKFVIYEEEISKNKDMKSKNLDLNKKFKIMQELVMKK